MKDLSRRSFLNIGLVVLFICFFGIVPASSQVTTPEQHLGYKPGDDFKLATYEQLVTYLEKIETQSGRIKVMDMGETSYGRRMKYAVISSEENIRNIDRYKEISKKLSLAQVEGKDEAKLLAKEGKAIVWIDAGIHSTETSPPMQQFQLAYNLVANEDEETQYIRDNVILLLIHANPDGMTIVADWYNKNVGTSYEKASLPELYHKYAGHDNNRDSYMMNLVETRNLNRMTSIEWHPELMYTQHERAPFPARIWLPPNPEPVNPNMHALVYRWKNSLGTAMGHRFDAEDKPGAISRTAFDLWYPGYTDGPSVETHNIPSVLTETANFGYATPNFYTVNDFPKAYQDLTEGTFYPSPWRGGWWRFKDAVDYNLTASMSVLNFAMKYKNELLIQKYKMAVDITKKFSNEGPYGWIVPRDQKDPVSTDMMIERLLGYGIEIYSADKSFRSSGIEVKAGSYIIPTSQPFGYYVKNIFEKQNYPDLREYPHLWQGIARMQKLDIAPLAPYDGVGWTLPLQMGVETIKISEPYSVDMTKVTGLTPRTSLDSNKYSKRVGLYRSWSANMDAGWISYILEESGVIYTDLRDSEIKAGGLKDRFDVIILPDQRASSLLNGHKKGTMPPGFVGGIGEVGVNSLKAFIEAGGVLFCNKLSADFAIEHFDLPVKELISTVPSDSFNCPGSIINIDYDTSNPLLSGMDAKGVGYFSRGRAFDVKEDSDDVNVLARYSDDTLLISGWMIGEERIAGKPAGIEVLQGKGKVILYGFNVHNRAQTRATFKLLLNVLQ